MLLDVTFKLLYDLLNGQLLSLLFMLPFSSSPSPSLGFLLLQIDSLTDTRTVCFHD